MRADSPYHPAKDRWANDNGSTGPPTRRKNAAIFALPVCPQSMTTGVAAATEGDRASMTRVVYEGSYAKLQPCDARMTPATRLAGRIRQDGLLRFTPLSTTMRT